MRRSTSTKPRAAAPAATLGLFALAALLAACRPAPPSDRVRASGQVDATDVRLSPEVGGRLLELHVAEGDRVHAGDLIARLDTTDTEIALRRARAEHDQAQAQLALLTAGSRSEDVERAAAELASAEAAVTAAQAQVTAAQADVDRFESLLANHSGSRKQRDDAVTRRDVAKAQLDAANEQARAARQMLAKLRAGARPQEIAAARARVDASAAQIASLEQRLADASLHASIGGIVTTKLVDVGELIAPHQPIVVVSDLDRPWADVYVDEPVVPRLRLNQAATVYTDAGGQGLAGRVTFIASQAEFTPRNVQTADERAKLVYRVKVSVDNRDGVLKEGMPVEAEIPLQPAPGTGGSR
jgi:HlyD family secretion protein